MTVNTFKDTRPSVQTVKRILCEIIDTYGCATVADYFDVIGIIPKYTDDKYGWTSLNKTKIVRTNEKDIFELILPEAHPLE